MSINYYSKSHLSILTILERVLLRVLDTSNGAQCETQRAAQDILRWVAVKNAVSIRVGVDLSSYIIESLTVD